MKALLIYPEFPDTFWGFKHALKFIRKKAAYPPLGLLTVAGMLPEGHDVRLIDLNVTELRERDLQRADIVLTALDSRRARQLERAQRGRNAGLPG